MEAVSRLIWLVGGDERWMLIAFGVAVIGLTVGRAVLFVVLVCCCCGDGAKLGILFSSEGFWRARLFRSASILAGLEM